jgi:hypothetical protein
MEQKKEFVENPKYLVELLPLLYIHVKSIICVEHGATATGKCKNLPDVILLQVSKVLFGM